MIYHVPVLLKECLEGLNIESDGTYVDVTFGGGGHSKAILERLGPKGRLIGFDQDEDAWQNVPKDDRFRLVKRNFSFLEEEVREEKVRGLLADLGVSSHQFDQEERGFSIRTDGPLDMRMDQSSNLTAEVVVNEYDEKELAAVLKEYGELNNARAVCGMLIRERKLGRITSTAQLVSILEKMAPFKKRNQFLAQVFQGLRIEVNDELEALEELLLSCGKVIEPGGRLVVLAYHSLEDRMVKNYIRTGNTEGKEVKDFYGNRIAPFKEVNRKPLIPDDTEILNNNRARSAKLRIAVKT